MTSPTKNQHITSIPINVLIHASLTGNRVQRIETVPLIRLEKPFIIAGISAGVGGYNSVLAKRLNSRSFGFAAIPMMIKLLDY